MPQLGETVTEGTITKWYKAVGDQVARDEPLFEVSTDKVDSEVPSPAEGVLTSILVEEGDTVDVGVTLAVIGDGSPSNGHAPAVEDAPAPAVEASAPEPPPAAPPTAAAPAPAPTATPAPAPAAPAPASASNSGEGMVLSPVVRKLLNEHGIDPNSVTGTGLGGRITRTDVEALVADGPGPAVTDAPAATAPPAPAAPAPVASDPAPAAAPIAPRAADGARDEVVPFTNIRRRTAEHMVRSKATSAHTLMVKEIDYERVEQVRKAHGDRFRAEEGYSLTYLPFAARATVEALAEYPHLNASVGEDALIVHHDVNLGIAVDLDNEGLIVPVVHNAEELNLRGMARRIRDLADRARGKRLSLDDISGGTFSITNAGPFGTLITGAIINQPQVAILSTDGVSRKPVVVGLPDGSESIAIHSVGLVAMSFDHRAVDGAYVARFLARLAEILNDRDWAGEL
jgi:2-oxoglutarate dehydrogenase E2 component (dihydrolipoamide succinyltransferase)